jgi:hypothetical protein
MSLTTLLSPTIQSMTYVVDNALDVVIESRAGGIDTVRSSVAWTLADALENLVLTGARAVSGTGNALDNSIFGNAAANVLRGGSGADRLDGGAGADTLIGGLGNDVYLLGRGYGSELIQENDGSSGNSDALVFLAGISSEQIWFRRVGNDLQASVIGTSDKATLQNWYSGPEYRVEEFHTSDGRTLLSSGVLELATAMSAFKPPPSGQTTLSASYAAVLPAIGSAWHPVDATHPSGKAHSAPGLQRGRVHMHPDIDPVDAALRTQAAGLIEAMAAFSSSADAHVTPPHTFHIPQIAVGPLTM